MPVRLLAHDLETEAKARLMRNSNSRTLILWLFPLPIIVGAIAGWLLYSDSGILLSGIIGGVLTSAFAGMVEIGALGLLGHIVQSRLSAPWYDGEDLLGYAFCRRPKHRAAVAASYPFMRPHPLPKVPTDLTWPLTPETDNGLAEMMRALYKSHRQSRGDMHAAVYAEVMLVDRTCVKRGYRHADAATVVMKLGVEQGLEAIRARIPAELATALV